MISDEPGKQLHDRATRGETLTTDEQAQLESWYAAQDSAEMKELGLAEKEEATTTLKAQVEAALAQLATVTQRIQELAAENDALRREISALRRQVPSLVSS